MSTAGTIGRRTLLTGTNNPDVQASKTWGNDTLIVASAAADGLVFVKDSAQPDGWGFSALTKIDVGLGNVENVALSTGNAATATLAASATVLATPRTINGVSFNGSANITVTADASTLTGTLLDARLSANVPLKNAGNLFSTVQTINRDAIAVTATDGLVIANDTPATAGIPVQQGPDVRIRSQVWNTTAVAATNTNDWMLRSVPVSGTSPTGLLKVMSSLNGAAATAALTITSSGVLTVTSLNLDINGYIDWGASRGFLTQIADGQYVFQTNDGNKGVGLDVAVDTIVRLRTRAHSAFATLDCLGLKASGVAGVSFGPAAIASITIVNGIVTAAS